MKKRAVVLLCLVLGLTAGCSSRDKGELMEWMKSLNAENVAVRVWTDDDFNGRVLTTEELEVFFTILHKLTADRLTENKHSAGITPEYGFRLISADREFYINQADAPRGQFEVAYQDKQWWIESSDLKELLRLLRNNCE